MTIEASGCRERVTGTSVPVENAIKKIVSDYVGDLDEVITNIRKIFFIVINRR